MYTSWSIVLILLSTVCLLFYCCQFTLTSTWLLNRVKRRLFPPQKMKRVPSVERSFMLSDLDPGRNSYDMSPDIRVEDRHRRTTSIVRPENEFISPIGPPTPIEARVSRIQIDSLLPTEPED